MSLLCMRVQVAKASNPTQVEAKEVRLSDLAPMMLDDTDVQTVSFIYSDWDLSSSYFFLATWLPHYRLSSHLISHMKLLILKIPFILQYYCLCFPMESKLEWINDLFLFRCCRSGVLYYWSFTTIWWCLRAETTYFHQQWPNPHRRRCCTPLYPLTSSASCLPNMKTSSIGTSLNFALARESQALFCRSYNLSLESILLSFWRQFFQLILLQDSALYVHELMGVFTT